MSTINLVSRYMLKFKNNISTYDSKHAKKKNADIRKTIMSSGTNEQQTAINIVWAAFYS